MLMVQLHHYPVNELLYAFSGELMGPEVFDDFHHQHGFSPTQCASKPQHSGMYRKCEAFWHGDSISGVGCMLRAPFPGILNELLLLTTILLTSILAHSNVVISNKFIWRGVMDTPTAGNLLREVARLHVHSQREQVACCNGTTSTQCLILTEIGRNGPMTLADLGRRTSLDKGWLSRAVQTLVQQGLLTKELGDHDRRTIRIALSPAGETRFQQLDETLDAHAQRVMARIPLAEQDQVAHALAFLYQSLQAEAAETAGIPSGEEDQR